MKDLVCPYCGAELNIENSNIVYKNRKRGNKVLICSNFPECKTWVNCDEHDKPLGTVANGKLRFLRQKAHESLNELLKTGAVKRRNIYKMISKEFHINMSECHIGMFDESMCRNVIEFSNRLTKELR